MTSLVEAGDEIERMLRMFARAQHELDEFKRRLVSQRAATTSASQESEHQTNEVRVQRDHSQF